MRNWCDTCHGRGSIGWLWWKRTCPGCDGEGSARPLPNDVSRLLGLLGVPVDEPLPDRPVTLSTCYSFTCTDCGTENYVHGVEVELTKEELQEARSALGIEPWEEGVLVRMPTTVTCRHCKLRYRTEDPRENKEEEA